MIPIKTKEEIEVMIEGGRRLARVFDQVLKEVKPGVETKRLDELGEALIKKEKGKPSFKMVPGYHWSTCINVNQGVVHGIPGGYRLKEGDLLSLDAGIFYQRFHTDKAETILVQRAKCPARGGVNSVQSEEKYKFLEAGKRALEKAIEMARPGNYLGQISKVIEKEIGKAGFSPVRALTGHGVGRKLHEEPQIPCFFEREVEKTPKLKKGMTLAIEIIYNQGLPEVVLTSDGWTIETKDGKISGLFEETVAVTAGGPLVLTR